MEYPKRKPNRLKNRDYSRPGAYFLTICTEGRKNLFWNCVGATIGRPQDVVLSEYGKIVDEAIQNIPQIYPMTKITFYTVMPNHIHILLEILADEHGRPMVAPTTGTVVQQLKGAVSKKIGRSIWQKLYHDHVVRNNREFEYISGYIYSNPMRWNEDCFYSK
jgi:REP element-mobilizing transposase RayT